MELYTDGGVIGGNPSFTGGTWAFAAVKDNADPWKIGHGMIVPRQMGTPVIGNNQMELLAVIRGLQAMPEDWCGIICSDSQITLGRIFKKWKLNNIPKWMIAELMIEKSRLKYWNMFQSLLLCGHPTKEDLERGFGDNGNPVSTYNVLCDSMCNREAEKFTKGDNNVKSWI